MKVCINPLYSPSDRTEGGIRRVVDAMARYLPEFGWEVTGTSDGADLIVNHGTYTDMRYGVPTIAACHGLYWAGYDWPEWGEDANALVIQNLREADEITVPSNWVGNAISRGLWRPTHTIYHGVEASEWVPAENRGYVLWNKARTDPVSNSDDLDKISDAMPSVPFVSTFGQSRLNSRIIGPQDHPTMKKLVQSAGVYLQTARETGGIGFMEAMACGVPVAGWKFGGQEEVIIEGETGYLAPFGDYEQLADCINRCFAERERLSKNAREDVLQRWGWEDKIEAYARLFHDTVDKYQRRRSEPRISVVITNYNLGQFVQQAMRSVDEQQITAPEVECIVVDDCSTDNSLQMITQAAEVYWSRGLGTEYFKVVRTPSNLGLSGARNYGASLAKGKHLIFLDADDMFANNALITMTDFLDRHPEFDIAFGGLATVNEAGEQQAFNSWPNGRFDFASQMAHLNQLSYASMMRKRVWTNLVGYRTRDWRAEDASFWCRAASFGYHIGCATPDPVLIYRVRSNSKSGVERAEHADVDGDWTSWFPWRLGATSGELGTALMDQTPKPVPNIAITPFGAQGAAPQRRRSWSVRHHQEPAVSIIIPVGPIHSPWLIDALDSVMAQTCPSWEVIVVYDNSQPLPTHLFPWARFMYSSGGIIPPYEPLGAGAARNKGIRAARAPLVLFLDADDVLRPNAVERLLSEYVAREGYIYCDTLAVLGDSKIADVATQDWRSFPVLQRGARAMGPSIFPAPTWDQAEFLQSGYDGRPGCHSVTALVATADALGVGGFDERMKALEDWEFFMRLAASGITGHLVDEPLFVYRLMTGTRREDRKGAQKDLEAIIRTRYAPFVTGEKEMCSCGGGGGGPQARSRAADAIAGMVPFNEFAESEILPDIQTFIREGRRVRLKYIGDLYGAVTYRGNVSREQYRAGQEPAFEFVDVDPRDVDHLMGSGVFKVMETVE